MPDENRGEVLSAPPGRPSIRLAGDTEWINECIPVRARHEHVSVFLVRAPGGNIVIDSGSFYHRDSIASRLREATDGQGVQAIILSHTDYPHSGNISAFRREWGDLDIVASSGAPEIQGLPYAIKATAGGSLTVRDREFRFLDPPLADRSHTTWIYDTVSGILYTADGFGSYHVEGECALTSDRVPGGITRASIESYHRDALPWLRYVDAEALGDKLRSIFERHDVSLVAPVHGHPIAGRDLPGYLDRLIEAAASISAAYRVPE